MQGPNVKKLKAYKMSLDAVPSGGTFIDAMKFLQDPKALIDGARKAQEWVEQAIALVKASLDNPYGDDDEAIAGEILRRLDVKKCESKNT